jgi:CheY-like chemotaxis protein
LTPVLAASDAVELVKAIVWPVFVLVIVLLLYPNVRRVIDSRGFTVKAGGAEITVQQASEQLAGQVDDLRLQVSSLRAQADSNGSGPAEDPGGLAIDAGIKQLRRVLWVDDHPENNAFERVGLTKRGVDVVEALSTNEAIRKLESGAAPDVIVTDMGRHEDGVDTPEAGLATIKAVGERNPAVPVVVYTSASTLTRTRDQALELGAAGVTASGTELLDMLGRLGCGASTAAPGT